MQVYLLELWVKPLEGLEATRTGQASKHIFSVTPTQRSSGLLFRTPSIEIRPKQRCAAPVWHRA
jgi:hypothetical protein